MQAKSVKIAIPVARKRVRKYSLSIIFSLSSFLSIKSKTKNIKTKINSKILKEQTKKASQDIRALMLLKIGK